MSDNQRKFLAALVKYGTLTKACKALGISISVGSRRKSLIVSNYLRAKQYIIDVDEYREKAVTVLGI